MKQKQKKVSLYSKSNDIRWIFRKQTSKHIVYVDQKQTIDAYILIKRKTQQPKKADHPNNIFRCIRQEKSVYDKRKHSREAKKKQQKSSAACEWGDSYCAIENGI